MKVRAILIIFLVAFIMVFLPGSFRDITRHLLNQLRKINKNGIDVITIEANLNILSTSVDI